MNRIQPSDKYVCADESAASASFASGFMAAQPSPSPSGCAHFYGRVQHHAFRLVTHKRFDHIVLGLILLNSVGLACDDPTGLYPDRQQAVDTAEMVFQVLFTVELILKVAAYGCASNTGYLSDGWNRLDAFIVTMGYIEWIVGDAAGGLSALRCVRALRPLRTINRLPQLKLIISTLLSSLPQLFHVLQLCGFVYSLFALIGLQIWSGDSLHRNCYSESTGSMQLTDDGGLQICNPGSNVVYGCDAGYTCIAYGETPNSGTISFDNFGTALTLAFWVASLESWTNVAVYLEDSQEWSEIWIMMIWFVAVVLIGGGLCMNLAPAVLKACFSDVADQGQTPPPSAKSPDPEEAEELVKMAENMVAPLTPGRFGNSTVVPDETPDQFERMAEELVASSPVSYSSESELKLDSSEALQGPSQNPPPSPPDSMGSQSAAQLPSGSGAGVESSGVGSSTGLDQVEATPVDEFDKSCLDTEVDKMIAEFDMHELQMESVMEPAWGSAAVRRRSRSQSIANYADEEQENEMKGDPGAEAEDAGEAEETARQQQACSENWLSQKCHTIATAMWFSNLFFLMICLNTVILTIDSNDLSDTGELVMQVFNYFFTGIFTIELVVKVLAFGSNFFRDSLNIFDLLIVIISLLEVGLKGGGSSSTSILRMLRMLRLARLLKVVRMSRSIGATRMVLSVLFAMLPTLQYIGLLCFLTAFVYAILGMGLFGGKMSFPGEGVPDANFDNFGNAFLTTFQLITLEDWPVVFESTKNATSYASILYVLMVVVIGNFVLLNLMLAIMLAFFEAPDMAAQITRRGVLVEGGGVQTNLGMEPEVEDEPATEKPVEVELVLDDVDVGCTQWCEVRRAQGSARCITLMAQWAITQKPFAIVIEVMIVINCIIMAVDPNQNITALTAIDACFTIVFLIEVVLKMIAYKPGPYWSDPANKLDFVVVSISVFSLALSSVDLGFLKALRAARVIRPLRLVTRSEGMMLVASSLLQSIPGMLNVGLVCFMGWLVFGILGMEFFKELDGGYCNDNSMGTEATCEGMYTNEYGTLVYRSWVTTDAKFSNTLITWLTLFQVASLEGWVDIMYYYTNHPQGGYFSSWYFLAWVMLSNWLLVNLWVGVIWINFVMISEERQGWAFLTESQRQWVVSQRRALVLEPTRSVLRPYRVNWVRRLCYDIVMHPCYAVFIDTCIVLNIITIALTHHNQSDAWDTVIVVLNTFFSINFFVEACLKICGFRWEGYWRDGWNKFEFVLALYVFGDIAVFIITFMSGVDLPEDGLAKLGLRVVVFTRCLRIVRLMRRLEGVSTMLYTLARALPAVCNIGLLLMLLLYMYAVAGVILFQDVLPRGGITHLHNFRHFGYSCWTIFLICTGDIWPDMMYNCMYTGDECSEEAGNCGSPAAALYFITLITAVTFLLLNMFVTILVDQFIEARRIFLGRITVNDLDHFRKAWAFYDREGLGYIAPHQLSALLIGLAEPLGLGASKEERRDIDFMKGLAFRVIGELHLTDYNGTAHFCEVISALSQRASREDVQGANLELLSQMLEEQREAAIPSIKTEIREKVAGFEGTIDERLAAMIVIRHIWRQKHVNGLKKGVIPASISADFKASVTLDPEEERKAAATLLRVCYMIWDGFEERVNTLSSIDPDLGTQDDMSVGTRT